MKVFHLLSLQVLSLFLINANIFLVRAQDDDADDEDVSVEATAPVVPEYTPPEGAETFAFEAEVNRMLDIVVNSLYQNKDVFLRELISNAADALDKFRYLSLTEPETYKTDDADSLEINIEYDSVNKTLTIRDTGIGMTKEQLIENLGTVARSGTTKFVEALKEAGNKDAAVDQIGQFGVGFYSSFLVSNRVTVASKHPISPKQYVWESTNGASDFVVFDDPRGDTMKRGTEITLHLRDDASAYLNPSNLRSLATHYSEFVTHPIRLRTTSTMEVEVEDEEEDAGKDEKKDDVEDLDDEKNEEKTEEDDDLEIKDEESKPKKMKEVTTYSWDTLNNNKAIWTRDKDTITDDEYQGFFHLINDGDNENATSWSHFNAEGNVNFRSILYLPTNKPAAYQMGNIDTIKGAVRLYVRRVLIGDEFELLPRYLSFVKGIVDSDELPLNVNRETLQESKILKVIKKKLTRKAIELVRDFAKKSADEAKKSSEDEAEISPDGEVDVDTKKKDEVKEDKYLKWYENFSPNIKYGVIEDEPNRGKLMKLLRFQTSKSDGKLISLAEYVENMKDWQDDIYVLGGTSAEEISQSPLLESFREKDVEVIYMTETIDEYMVKHARDYERKKFVDVSAEGVKFKDEDQDLLKRREKAYQNKFKPLTKWLKKLYGSTVLRVQVAKRSLGSIPAVVSSSDFGNSANMERIMRAQAFQSDDTRMSFRIFELNPRHPLVVKLLEGCPPEDADEDKPFEPSQETIDSAWILHDMAMLNGGYPISDPIAHNKRLTKVLQKRFELDSLDLEPAIDPPVEEDEPPEPDMDFGGLNMDDFDMGSLGDDIDLDSL
ncbi:hypothetical protein ACA910_011270 [Epithemia clementina (nom. ined.)]